jgi:hypothetical protein
LGGIVAAQIRLARQQRTGGYKAVFKQVHKLLLFLALLWAFAPSSTQAQVINYPTGFAGSSGQIWLTGAQLSGSRIELLDGGIHTGYNAFYETPVNIQAFTTNFTFQASCSPNPSDCGNGFGFEIIADNSSNPKSPGYTYSGWSGAQFSWSMGCDGSIGGAGCEAIDEAIVKFDLYGNTAPGQNLTNYYQASTTLGGIYPQGPTDINMAPAGINIQSGDIFNVTLAYDGSNLNETVIDTDTNATFTHTYTGINLPSVIGANTAFVGFGGGTGAATMDLDLNAWVYSAGSASPTPTATATHTPTLTPTATVTATHTPTPTVTPTVTPTPTATPTVKPTATSTPKPSPTPGKAHHHKKWDPPPAKGDGSGETASPH